MLEIFKLNRIRWEQMYSDAKNFLTAKYQQSAQVFTSASPFGQLLSVIIDLGHLIFYYVEDSITELNIYTASRKTSIQGLARIAGHNPTRAISATGTAVLSYNGKQIDMYGNTAIIPNYTKLTNKTTGFTYLIKIPEEQVRLTLSGKNSVEVKVIQGIIESQQFTGTGGPLQSYTAQPRKNFQIDNFEITVYVNNEKWKHYDSLYDVPYQEKGVLVKTGIHGGIDIYFGNGYFGMIPERGATIRVEYLTTSGDAGNILMDEIPDFEFLDSGYDTTGNEIDLNQVLGVKMGKQINFGTDPEPLLLTKLLAPKTSKAYVLANADSYVYFLMKFNFFSVIDAFSTFEDDDISDDNVVYLFLIPDVNKRKAKSDDYFSVPQNLFILTDEEKQKVYDLIEQSGQKIITTIIKIIDPIIKKYVINININAFEGFNKDGIRQQIISKLSDYFLKNKRRDKIPRSDLISILEDIEGVDSVNLWFMSEENEAFKTIPNNANESDIGLDEFGDIVIGKGEYPLIRGGWNDRNGVIFDDSTNQNKPSSVNITFGKDSSVNLNTELHRIEVKNIKSK